MTGNKNKSTSFILLTIVFLVLLGIADFGIFYTLPLRFLYPVTFDAGSERIKIVAILFNDFDETYTGINNETKRRANHGIILAGRNSVEKLVLVGGNREASQRKGAQLMADYLLEQGVPRQKILIEHTSRDTVSNLEQLGKLLAEEDMSTITLVSSPYHLMRIKNMQIQSRVDFIYSSYNPADCFPPLSRSEIWYSAHYNIAAYVAQTLLPGSLYREFVKWIRENTEL